VLKHIVSNDGAETTSEMKVWSTLADAQPELLVWLTSPEFTKQELPNSETMSPAKKYIASALSFKAHDEEKLYPYFIFTHQTGGALLSWLEDGASPDEMQVVRRFFTDITNFQERHTNSSKCVFSSIFFQSYYDKATIRNDEAWNERKEEAIAKGHNVPTHTMRLKEKVTPSGRLNMIPVGNSPGAGIDCLKLVETLLGNLASQIPCEYAVLLPMPGNEFFPMTLSGYDSAGPAVARAAGVPEMELSIGVKTPAELAMSTNKAVFVDNFLADPRFDRQAISPKAYSMLCVPLAPFAPSELEGANFRRYSAQMSERPQVILKLINKKSASGVTKGLPFRPTEDGHIVSLFGELIMERLSLLTPEEIEALKTLHPNLPKAHHSLAPPAGTKAADAAIASDESTTASSGTAVRSKIAVTSSTSADDDDDAV